MEKNTVFLITAAIIVVALIYFTQLPAEEEFEAALKKIEFAWKGNGMDLDEDYSAEELLALDEGKLNSVKAKLTELMDSTEKDSLKHLTAIHLEFVEEFILKKAFLQKTEEISSIGDNAICEQEEKLDELIELNQKLYDLQIETNALINGFIEEYPEETEKTDIELRKIDEEEAFSEWFDVKNSILEIKEECLGETA